LHFRSEKMMSLNLLSNELKEGIFFASFCSQTQY
jgi:hypothetical protein